jgi:uncharacterized protein (TIGR02594 family)
MQPNWMNVALAEIGEREIAGPLNNTRIVEYHRWTSLAASDDETPWCSAFANWVMGQCGIKGTNSAAARSWLTWGRESGPVFGAVTVLWRGKPESPQGHVGFLDRIDARGIWLLGGNQGDRVSIAAFPPERVLAFRWAA